MECAAVCNINSAVKHVNPQRIVPQYCMSGNVLLCHAMLFHAMLCHAMICYAMVIPGLRVASLHRIWTASAVSHRLSLPASALASCGTEIAPPRKTDHLGDVFFWQSVEKRAGKPCKAWKPLQSVDNSCSLEKPCKAWKARKPNCSIVRRALTDGPNPDRTVRKLIGKGENRRTLLITRGMFSSWLPVASPLGGKNHQAVLTSCLNQPGNQQAYPLRRFTAGALFYCTTPVDSVVWFIVVCFMVHVFM